MSLFLQREKNDGNEKKSCRRKKMWRKGTEIFKKIGEEKEKYVGKKKNGREEEKKDNDKKEGQPEIF